MSLWELQVIRDLLCLRGIPEKSLNRMLLLLILKTSHRKYSIKKSAWKFCQFHKKIPVSLFNKFAGLRAWSFLKKRLQHMYFFQWNLRNFWEHLLWSTFVNLCFCFVRYLFTMYEKDTASKVQLGSSQTYVMEFFGENS